MKYHYAVPITHPAAWFHWTDVLVLPLLYKLVCHLLRFCFGRGLGKLILPAQWLIGCAPDASVGPRQFYDFTAEPITYYKWNVTSEDQVRLETFEMSQDPNNSNCPHIIIDGGNGTSAASYMSHLIHFSQKLGATAISFSHRNVAGSDKIAPQSKQDLVRDLTAQVQRLLDKGVAPHNIMIYGHSLGAGTASIVVSNFHAAGVPINMFSDRSFSSLTDVVIGHLQHYIGFASMLFHPIVKAALVLMDWEINEGYAMRQIPRSNREYQFVDYYDQLARTHVEDSIITSYGSVHQALKDEYEVELKAAQNQPELLKYVQKNDNERHIKSDHMRTKLEHFSDFFACKYLPDPAENMSNFKHTSLDDFSVFSSCFYS